MKSLGFLERRSSFRGRRSRLWPLLGLLLTAGTGLTARADWPMLSGGPAHLGVATGPGPTALAVTWSTLLDASVDASPAVAAGRVYVGTADGDLCAVAEDTGALLWRFPTGGAVVSSPAVAGDRLLFGSADHYLYCVSTEGRLLWKYRTWGPVAGSPTVAETLAYCGSMDGTLTAFDLATGAVKWQVQEPAGITCAPAVDAGLVVCGDRAGTVRARRAETGELVWSADSPDPVIASPTIAQGVALVPHCSHTALSPPKVDYLVAYDPQTGARRWALNGDSSVFTTPAVAGGVVYFGCVSGYLSQTELRAVRLSDGLLLWRRPLGSLMLASSPVVAGNRLFLGLGDGAVYSLALDTGEIVGRLPLCPRLYSSAAVSEGHLFIGGNDGKLYCVGP